jgi:flagellar protein FliJ
MSRYKFPLQKLLDMRIDKEEESKREFMEAQRQRNLEEAKLNKLKADYSKFNVENAEDDIVKRRIKENYLAMLKKHMIESKDELQRRNEILEQKRLDMAQKQIDRKTVETLKDKRIEAFQKEQDDIETKANDEFALYAHIRKLERR